MYKQCSEFFSTGLAKKVSGLPQTDRLLQQRRKANSKNPVVPITKTSVYCGSTPVAKDTLDRLRRELKDLRKDKKDFDSLYNKLYTRHLKLLDFVNSLPPRYRPKHKAT